MKKNASKSKKSLAAKGHISLIGGILFLVACLVPLGLIGTFLCVHIPSGALGLVPLLGLAFPWLVLAALAIGTVYLFFFKKRCLIFFAAILLNFHNLTLFVRLPGQNGRDKDETDIRPTDGPRELKVLSYNVCLFGFYAAQKALGELKDKISTFIQVEEADIVCLQEYYESKDRSFRIRESLRQAGYRHHTQPTANARFYFGNVIFSRFPILRQDTVPGLPQHAIYADLLLPSHDTLRVYTFHLASLRFDDNDKWLYNELLQNRQVTESISYKAEAGKIARKVGTAARIHDEQIRLLKTHVNACPYALLLCGDMNENPISYAYHTLADGLKDAFVEQGVGLGRTYNGLFPAYRIDYIFYRPDGPGARMKARYFEVGDIHYSDHKPISAVLKF